MKSIISLCVIIFTCACAVAGPMPVWKDGVTRTYWPREIVWPDGRVTVGANVAQCIAAGAARWETETEWTAREAADAAAQAEAEAQAALYAFPEPNVVVPVLDSEGNATGTARLLVDSDGNIVAVTDTASPQRTVAVQIEEFKAKIAGRESKKARAKAAKKNGKLQDRIAALEALLGVE